PRPPIARAAVAGRTLRSGQERQRHRLPVTVNRGQGRQGRDGWRSGNPNKEARSTQHRHTATFCWRPCNCLRGYLLVKKGRRDSCWGGSDSRIDTSIGTIGSRRQPWFCVRYEVFLWKRSSRKLLPKCMTCPP